MRDLERSFALETANTIALGMASVLAQILGNVDESIKIDEFLVARDPVNPFGHLQLGFNYLLADRLDEAIASFRTALALNPEMVEVHFRIGLALLQKGEFEAALAEMQKEPFKGYRLVGLAMVDHPLWQAAGSEAALAELIENYAQEASQEIAWALALHGENDRAFEWLEKAVQQSQPSRWFIARDNALVSLHDDPRWLPLLEKIGSSPAQLDAIEFNVTLPE